MDIAKTILAYFGLMAIFSCTLFIMWLIFTRVFEKRKKKHGKKYVTYTKKWLTIILVNGLIWVYLSYILAFLGREQIAETLSIQAVISIIATMTGYFAKSAFEKKIGKEKEEYESFYEKNIE
ncbi:MAG: hypothetical protein J6K12_05280 [Clostridia bacterium]|nr:hypothetical protein [Clostridia bacterium]